MAAAARTYATLFLTDPVKDQAIAVPKPVREPLALLCADAIDRAGALLGVDVAKTRLRLRTRMIPNGPHHFYSTGDCIQWTPENQTFNLLLYLSPAFARMTDSARDQMQGVIGHELHHIGRTIAHRYAYGLSLFEALISEGLACDFSRIMTKTDWGLFRGTPPQDPVAYARHIAPSFLTPERRGDKRLFGGAHSAIYFQHCGYAAGLEMIQTFKAAHGISDDPAHTLDAKDVLSWLATKPAPFGDLGLDQTQIDRWADLRARSPRARPRPRLIARVSPR